MKPIIFARITSMNYYKGITDNDQPENGGAFVRDTNQAHECYNFEAVKFDDGKEECLGFVQLLGNSKSNELQIKIENIVGCEDFKNEEYVEGVTIVWCAKAKRSKNIRVVGFYKNATVFRHYKEQDFSDGYVQFYNFVADKKDCVLLPYHERFNNGDWYVPTSHKNNYNFGFGRSSIWYAGSKTEDEKEIEYVEKMINSIENYNGENWIDKGGEQ